MRVRVRCTALLLGTIAACGGVEQAPPERAIPCEVNAVLVHVCQKCHSSPPANGVPISLVTYDDTQALYSDRATYHDTPVWKVMRDLVRAGIMPQPPVVLDAADRATLLDWLDRGAPAATGGVSCP
jgi:hypothetical protein